jgi:hypothetical protein
MGDYQIKIFSAIHKIVPSNRKGRWIYICILNKIQFYQGDFKIIIFID